MVRSNVWHHVISGLISCTILAVGVTGFVLLKQKGQSPAAERGATLPPLVATVPLTPHDGTLDISIDGTVVPFREISTSAEVAGRVVFKSADCNAGTFVTEGTRLLQIDPQEYELQELQLTHQLDEANASIEELAAEIVNTGKLIELSREDLVLQQRELARMTNLAVGVVTESDLDRARQLELAARNALTVLENQLNLQTTRKNRLVAGRKIVETQLERAKLDTARTEIRAQADGVIVTDLVEEGDYVQKGTPLVTLEDTSAVEVKCNLQMDELFWIWRSESGQDPAATVHARAYQIPQVPVTVVFELAQSGIRYEWSGRLSRFDGIGLDARTRTVPCRVVVDAPRSAKTVRAGGASSENRVTRAPALVRGMYVVVEIHATTNGNLVRLPERAVHPGKAVWVVRDGRLRVLRPIQLIELVELTSDEGEAEQYWIVDASASALTLDDQVIVTPLTAVTDDMPVRLEASP